MAIGNSPTGRGNDFTVQHHVTASAVDEWVWIAPRKCKLLEHDLLPTVAGTDAGAVTYRPRRITADATAPGAAAGATVIELTAATVDLKSTANTLVSPALIADEGDRTFEAGDRLALNYTGTLTAVNALAAFRFLAL